MTSFCCPLCCHQKFDSIIALREHLLYFTYRPLICVLCSMTIEGIYELTRHLQTHLFSSKASDHLFQGKTNSNNLLEQNDTKGINVRDPQHSSTFNPLKLEAISDHYNESTLHSLCKSRTLMPGQILNPRGRLRQICCNEDFNNHDQKPLLISESNDCPNIYNDPSELFLDLDCNGDMKETCDKFIEHQETLEIGDLSNDCTEFKQYKNNSKEPIRAFLCKRCGAKIVGKDDYFSHLHVNCNFNPELSAEKPEIKNVYPKIELNENITTNHAYVATQKTEDYDMPKDFSYHRIQNIFHNKDDSCNKEQSFLSQVKLGCKVSFDPLVAEHKKKSVLFQVRDKSIADVSNNTVVAPQTYVLDLLNEKKPLLQDHIMGDYASPYGMDIGPSDQNIGSSESSLISRERKMGHEIQPASEMSKEKEAFSLLQCPNESCIPESSGNTTTTTTSQTVDGKTWSFVIQVRDKKVSETSRTSTSEVSALQTTNEKEKLLFQNRDEKLTKTSSPTVPPLHTSSLEMMDGKGRLLFIQDRDKRNMETSPHPPFSQIYLHKKFNHHQNRTSSIVETSTDELEQCIENFESLLVDKLNQNFETTILSEATAQDSEKPPPITETLHETTERPSSPLISNGQDENGKMENPAKSADQEDEGQQPDISQVDDQFSYKSFPSNSEREIHKRKQHRSRGSVACKFCQKKFANLVLRYRHQKEVHSTMFYICNLCGRHFKSQRTLTNHKGIHEKKQFECTQCTYVCHTASGLRTHVFECHSTKTLQICCAHCGDTFKKKYGLKRHIERKHNSQKLLCKYCDKEFPCQEDLKLHLNTHLNNKSLTCRICNKIFTTLSSLKRHGIRHKNNNLKFKCTKCPSTFSRQYLLTKHITIHGRDSRSSAVLLKQSNININAQKHTKNQPKLFQCEVCQKTFTLKTILNNHYCEDRDNDT